VSRPLSLVVSGDPVVAAQAAFPGWDVRTGDLPSEPFDLSDAGAVWAFTVTRHVDVTRVLLAATRGAPTVIALDVDVATASRLLDDLGRAAEVRSEEAVVAAARLTPEHVAVLAAVADGCSLEDAATRLAMSRRTAARRLAEARVALAARTTVEAVHAATRLGLVTVPSADRHTCRSRAHASP
jgi:hypothetical protein